MSAPFATGVIGRFLELKRDGFNPKRILDVGANTGQFAHKCHSIWPEAHVTSIEANPACEAWLSLVADEWHMALVSDSERDVLFWIDPENRISHGNSYYRETLPFYPHDVSVPMRTTTLSELLKDREPYDLVKLDTQGSELDVIRGGREIVMQAKYVLCEMRGAVESNENAPTRETVEAELAGLGFGDGMLLEWWFPKEHPEMIVNEDWIYTRAG